MKTPRLHATHAGFTLVEVMVALLVISIGLLGIAKMQALALSSTASARLRSLGALEAASLSTMMGADRSYWASSATTATPLTITVQNGAISNSSDVNITGTPNCSYPATCTVATQMATYDLNNWATALNAVLPNALATISCSQPAAVAPNPSSPVSCSIQIQWAENLVQSNSAQSAAAAAAAAANTPQYTVVVQP